MKVVQKEPLEITFWGGGSTIFELQPLTQKQSNFKIQIRINFKMRVTADIF